MIRALGRPVAACVAAAVVLLLGAPSLVAAQNVSRETPVVKAVREAGPAVVNISSLESSGPRSPFPRPENPLFDKFFKDFFGEADPGGPRGQASLGSGVIIDGKKGLVLTNEHVISRATEITVSTIDNREMRAEVVGSDPDSDLAVLHIETREKLPALRMGDSSDLMIGESVIAIGNPFGLTHTVTTGVISAVGRTISNEDGRVFRDFIQTDASINPGNSGGPLMNINGQLIGINTAIFTNAQGIGFAIPINKAKRIINDLISYGSVQPAWLGLNFQPLTERLARYFKAPAEGGALIIQVDPDGPAVNSGLQPGDVIVSLDQSEIRTVDDYEDVLKGYSAGVEIQVRFYRMGAPKAVKLKTAAFPPEKAQRIGWYRYGISVAPTRGANVVTVKEVRPGSPAHEIGLESGDYILQINEVKTDTVDSFLKAMTRYQLRDRITMVVQRGRQAYRITLSPQS